MLPKHFAFGSNPWLLMGQIKILILMIASGGKLMKVNFESPQNFDEQLI
jgi:hypothetical protein